MPRSERELMLAGELYWAGDPELAESRRRARRLTRAFNVTTEEQPDERRRILTDLFARVGPRVEVEPPFHCDYGWNIFADDNLFMNFGCVILDCAPVRIGKNVLMAPGVHIYAATHPIDPAVRATGRELARPVTIGDDVWIGGGAIICPGVTIGNACTIGAGSVVTRDIPPNSTAVGNPARVRA